MALPEPSPESTCLITGASSGIGVEIARALAKRGQNLVLLARRVDRLESLASELTDEFGVRVEVLGCDVSDPSARAEVPDRVAEFGLTVELLVNNAGYGTAGKFVELDPEREVGMVRVNVEAVTALCGTFVPPMVDRGRGAVLNVASTIAFQPIPGQAGYAATKAYVLSFTQALHTELHGTGVTATALCPGPVKTEFMDEPGMEESASALPKPMWLDPAEVAEAGVRGVESGDGIVVPGVANVVTRLIGRHTPRWLLLNTIRRLTGQG
ncbi:MAG: SDR family oxidoreductase [Actinomycetia bacterium]|nr:SDR family oxidoreductase [Actinomycetes bacterium]